MNKRIAVLLMAGIGVFAAVPEAFAGDAPQTPEPLYAKVDGTPVTQRDFHAAFTNFLRQKYYHGQVPEGQIEQARHEVGDQLVDRVLLLREAQRQGLQPDEKKVADTISGYEQRYAASEMWQKNRETLLPGLKKQLEEQDLLAQMETIGHAIPEVDDAAVRSFYAAKPELFTEPEKQRIHTILLKVDPSAPAAQWEAARVEAADIVARLRADKATFEDLARLHSLDRSADDGGDMGYVHRGMIPETIQTRLDTFQLGAVGDPIDVLEGVAIFRVDERVSGKLMPYEAVATRARELLERERTADAWRDFVARLRAAAKIEIVDAGNAPAPASGPK
jgi:parvulin-like peptidyl-prolyl isomerase